MIFNINQNQLPATGGWGRKGKEKVSRLMWDCQKRQGKKKITPLAPLGPLMRVGLCQRGSPCAKVSGNKEVGLGRTSILQVNLLFLREILAFILQPTFSAIFHPTPTPTHFPSAAHIH